MAPPLDCNFFALLVIATMNICAWLDVIIPRRSVCVWLQLPLGLLVMKHLMSGVKAVFSFTEYLYKVLILLVLVSPLLSTTISRHRQLALSTLFWLAFTTFCTALSPKWTFSPSLPAVDSHDHLTRAWCSSSVRDLSPFSLFYRYFKNQLQSKLPTISHVFSMLMNPYYCTSNFYCFFLFSQSLNRQIKYSSLSRVLSSSTLYPVFMRLLVIDVVFYLPECLLKHELNIAGASRTPSCGIFFRN